MKYTANDVKQATPASKTDKDSLWVKLWVRTVSYQCAAVALNCGLSPNAVSVIAILDAVLGSFLICLPNRFCVALGMIVLNFFIVLDCMDGSMARTLKRNSYMGEFYDAMGGYAMGAFSLLGATVCAYRIGGALFAPETASLLVIGALGSITELYARLIYQKYTVNEMFSNSKLGKPVTRENDQFYVQMPKFGLTYLRMVFDRQFGVGGVYPPLMPIAYLAGLLDVFVVLYSLYHIAAFVAVLILFCVRASRYDKINGSVH